MERIEDKLDKDEVIQTTTQITPKHILDRNLEKDRSLNP